MLEIKGKKSPKSVFWEEVFIAKLPREDTLKDNLSGNFRRIFTFSKIGQFPRVSKSSELCFFPKKNEKDAIKITKHGTLPAVSAETYTQRARFIT